MKIKSYYMVMRKRWGLIPKIWNKFFQNLSDDYTSFKSEIDGHAINDKESELQAEIIKFASKEGI